ncbi:LysR family transcriptional regulator [Shewanella algidipiscicola]|uniref:LysR family transcriptional regulator n=1 Tax=Shewanella algidipiscicola TaxID=614070 RepID=A0ABQ4PAX5_9GAMM|nr:LysR family transcriptional regulator [Shewanella algidipiscicola]GIU44712.1 LysR family transcriptional regulator [Shewanella algidipiscicola]
MKNITLDSLDMLSANILVNLYEKHSASSVAIDMNIPAPKVSRCLQHARMMFNDPLFIRKKHGLEPNEFTRQLYPIVKELVQCSEHLYQLNHINAAESHAAMVIYVSDLLIAHFPQQLSAAINEAHLPISFELRSGSQAVLDDIANGLIDMAVVSESNPSALQQDQRLSVMPLKALSHLYLLCGLEHPILQQEISLANMANYPYLSAFNQLDKAALDPFEAYCRQQKCACHLAPRDNMQTSLGFHDLYRYLADNHTLSIVPYSKVYEQSYLLPGLHVCCLSTIDTALLYADHPLPRLYLVSAKRHPSAHFDWLKQTVVALIKQEVH